MSSVWDKYRHKKNNKNQFSSLKINFNEPNIYKLLSEQLNKYLETVFLNQRIAIVCVGTDRSTGDSLGPLVGTLLAKTKFEKRFDLYGTLEQPVHAMNLENILRTITSSSESKPYIIAVDACLGQVSNVGCIQIGAGPIYPGAGVNKELPPIGDIHITGIVNVSGFMEYFILQNTRLNLVVKMSEIIAASLLTVFDYKEDQVTLPFS